VTARANQLLEAGLWLKMSGDLDGARRLFEQALKIDPDSIRARELLGHSMPESEAVPEELRDVPVDRTDLFSVPLPRLFQDEAPAAASMPDEWWNAPPSDGMGGNTSRFFVRPAASGAPSDGPTHTIPWGPSPLPPRAPPAAPSAKAPDELEAEFGGDDLGESGDDFGLELSDGTPPPLRRSGPRPLPLISQAEPLSPAAAGLSRTTGAIPLPPLGEPSRRSPIPGPPGSLPEPTFVAGSGPSRTTGAIPLPPAGTPAPMPPSLSVAPPPLPRAEPGRTSGPVPLPPTVAPLRTPPGMPSTWQPPGGPVRPTPTLETHVIVPLPPGPEPSPPLEPVPWSMPPPAPAPLAPPPRTAQGAVPLPPSIAPAFSPPRGSPAVSETPSGSIELPNDAWGSEGDGPTLLAPEEPAAALELLAEPRTISGLTPLPAPKDPRSEASRMLERARELQNLDDHSGARELLLQAQALSPDLTGLTDALARSETKLQTIYESKIGKLSAIPRVRLKEDEVIWLNLDHRAGFMLAQIDGTLSFEDLFSVSGMSRLDTARILAQLLDQRVIVS
jgi:hypothetical protein